jgi:hypothetical protein
MSERREWLETEAIEERGPGPRGRGTKDEGVDGVRF